MISLISNNRMTHKQGRYHWINEQLRVSYLLQLCIILLSLPLINVICIFHIQQYYWHHKQAPPPLLEGLQVTNTGSGIITVAPQDGIQQRDPQALQHQAQLLSVSAGKHIPGSPLAMQARPEMRQPQQSTPLGGWGPSCSGAPSWSYDNRSSISTSAPGFSQTALTRLGNTRHDCKYDKGVLTLMQHLFHQPAAQRTFFHVPSKKTFVFCFKLRIKQ